MSRRRLTTRTMTPTRRGTANTNSTVVRHAVADVIERLESRTLLTTIVTDTNPLTATPATQQFEYKDARGQTVRVVVHGDVSAEFVFARVTKGAEKTGFGGNDVILGEFVPPLAPNDKGQLVANPEDGRDLFHVFVAQASIDSYISIARVANPPSRNPRPMQPFDGSVTLTVQPSSGDEVRKQTAGGTGSIYLGARTRDTAADIDDEADVPIRSARYNGQGLLPANSRNRLTAGFSTAPGVSLGRFLFGGAVSGQVIIQGSMETWYCGALLTGVTEGQIEGAPIALNNFYVAGDIRNILVKGAVGTNEVVVGEQGRAISYFTGVDFEVKGRVGQIRTGSDYAGVGTITNSNQGLGLRTRQQEIETRVPDGLNRGLFTEFENGQFGDREAFFHNDTFETAQFLGSINSKQTGANSVQVNGLYQWVPRVQDLADYYAVPLMAGQSITVRLIAPDVFTAGTAFEINSVLHVGVFDPERRLIASDYGDNAQHAPVANNLSAAQQQQFTFTADKPGIYRFAVGKDPTFSTPGFRLGLEQPYQLQITGVGSMGLGGLVAQESVYAISGLNADRSSVLGSLGNIEVVRGDLGAVHSIGDFIVSGLASGFNAIADGGDLRAIDAVSLGQFVGAAFGSDATIAVLTGSVGMIRSTGTDIAAHTTQINAFGRGTALLPPIGGDVQWIVAPNTFVTDLAVNGSVGVIQATRWGFTNYAGSLSVNADETGRPGVIDLIDVTGDIGTLQAGGPLISTGPGGNIRYMKIGPAATAYRPFTFGSSTPEETTFVQGQTATLTDDSGAQVVLTPTQQDVIDPLTGLPLVDINGNPVINSGTLTVLTYPIARSITNQGGGGVAIVRVTSTRGVRVNTTGANAEIGSIVSTGTGPALVTDPGPDLLPNTGDEDLGEDQLPLTGDEPFVIDPANLNDNSIDIRGARTDVYEIRGNNFNSIRNGTGGEVPVINAGQVGNIDGTTLGIATSAFRPGMAVEQTTVIDNPGTAVSDGNTFPLNLAKTGVSVNGGSPTSFAVSNIRATRALGNVVAVGTVGNLQANSDNQGVRGVHEGIVGAAIVTGQLRLAQVGEGLNPSGSGNMGRAGLYAVTGQNAAATVGRIERVVARNGASIRGDIVTNNGIGDIEVTGGGSIINADIMNVLAPGVVDPNNPGGGGGVATGTGADLSPSREFSGLRTIVSNSLIDNILVQGAGGIIGTTISSASIGPIRSLGGFGIINTSLSTLGNGRFGAVTADGYGVRGVDFDGGQSLDSLSAVGPAKRLTTTSFSPDVRMSESLAVDPFFGTKPNALTDLHVLLGTTAKAPQRKGVSNGGSIDLSEVRVSRDVGAISANTIRASVFNVPNQIASINTGDYVDSMQVTAGRINRIDIGKDALRSSIQVAGPVGPVSIGGSFRGSSNLSATGANGSIQSFTTGRSLYGNVYAQQSIGSIRVGTVYGSAGGRTAGSLREFITNGDVLTGSKLEVEKELTRLVIGGDVQDGAAIRVGTLGTKTIIGDEVEAVNTKPW